ncbi:fibroleukin [Drosophila busckii]|uniref:fibroleukin n=1 Tax=Drosophila busckii TaxID=30019 RepID=UPI0014328E10|nr:fibroleukin [Drosophila busckii]
MNSFKISFIDKISPTRHRKLSLKQDLTINNLQNEVKDTLKRSEQLQDKLHRQDLSNKAQEIKFLNQHANQLLTNNQYQRPTIIRNFGNLYTYINEPTNCVAYGNDIQTIRVPGTDAFQVPCDSKFAGPGWAVIQRRVDGSVNFNRTWEEYRNGFGDLRGEFWLGLEKLHLMTKFQPHELYIQLEDFKNEKRYARYTNFSVGNEAQSYELLSVGEYNGNAGDALSYLKNTKFTTKDRDNDKGNGNCGGFMHVISVTLMEFMCTLRLMKTILSQSMRNH